MPEFTSLALYFSAALILAITPGPGMLYVLTRSIRGGRGEGYASSFGTAVGGLFHVAAAATGLSAILTTSALAFMIVKYVGAAYLIYIGITTILQPDTQESATDTQQTAHSNAGHAFRQGIVTEILNPKTALFFFAFIPQFVNPTDVVFMQFIILGCISVFLNTFVDVIVASLAGPIGQQLKTRASLRRGQRMLTGTGLVALGTYVAVSGND